MPVPTWGGRGQAAEHRENARIHDRSRCVVVPGFGLATVTLKDGSTVAGSLLKQDDKGAVVKLADGKEVTIAKDKIDKITPPLSPMLPMGAILSASELRDVMAYMNSLK